MDGEDEYINHPDDEDDVIVDENGEFEADDDDMIDVPEEGGEYVFDVEEGAEQESVADDSVVTFSKHGDQPVYAVAAGHNGDLIASGGGDDRAFIWSSSSTAAAATASPLGKHSDSVVAVSFSSGDEWVASGGMDGMVKVVNLKTKQELSLEGPGSELEWIAWHPKHPVVLAGSTDTTTWMWNCAEEGAMMGVFAGHTDVVTCGSFTPNGRRVVTGSQDGSLKLWDPNGCACLHTFSGRTFHHGGVVTLLAKEDEPIIATGGSDGTVCLVKLDTKKVLAKLTHAEPSQAQNTQNRAGDDDNEDQADLCSVECLAFCPTLPWLVSGGTDGRVVVWDLTVQAKRSVLTHPDEQAVVRTIFVPNSVCLITACADAKIRKWDARASKLEKTLTGHRDAILDMALLSDGKRVVTASDDGTCKVFQFE